MWRRRSSRDGELMWLSDGDGDGYGVVAGYPHGAGWFSRDIRFRPPESRCRLLALSGPAPDIRALVSTLEWKQKATYSTRHTSCNEWLTQGKG